MRFALVFADPISIELAWAIFRAGTHELVACCEPGPWQKDLERRGVATASGPCTSILGTPSLDAVLVGRSGSDDHRAEALRTFVQAELPILAVHPIGDMLFGFELQMAQAENKVPILPFFPAMYHPLFAMAEGWLRDPDSAPVGQVRQVDINRQAKEITVRAMETAFCQDAMLLRLLLGRILRVSSLSPSQPQEHGQFEGISTSRNVQMLDERNRVATWNLNRGESDQVSMSVAGDRGKLELTMAEDPKQWVARVGGVPLPVPNDAVTDPYLAALNQMAAAIQTQAGRQTADQRWEHACRSVELADAVARSSRRGRTIELYHEEHTEESSFRAVMATGGCLALMAILAVIPLVALGEQLLPDPEPGSRWLRAPWIVVVTLLCLFLALQFLRLVVRR